MTIFWAPGRVLACGDLDQGSLGLVGTLNNQQPRVGFWRKEGGHDSGDQLAWAWGRAAGRCVCGAAECVGQSVYGRPARDAGTRGGALSALVAETVAPRR